MKHDMGHLTGCSPILVLDVFEHAFILDFGLRRDEYIEAFMRNARWKMAPSVSTSQARCLCPQPSFEVAAGGYRNNTHFIARGVSFR